jgi:hypothetical protein
MRMGLGILVKPGIFPGLYGFKVLESCELLRKGGEVGMGH